MTDETPPSGPSGRPARATRLPVTSRNGSVLDVTWMACYRKRVAHAVPADVHSPAYDHPAGLIEAVCGIVVYPLRVAEANARRCQECTATLLPGTSGDAR
jgi:hypothetical protein